MRYLLLVLLLLLAATLSACSFSTDFVVVNASDHPIEVLYKIGETSIEPFDVTRKPATLQASQLRSREWKELSSTQYALDREKRSVKVSLTPGVALRINHGEEWREGRTGADFIIKEVNIRGANGEITLKGEQVYKSFVPESKPFFGPPTLLTMTYK
jgi:hypothetical protein